MAIKIGVGVIAAFVIAEITLRLLGFPSVNTNTFDKDNLVIFKQNREFLVKDRCYASTLVTNDQGFHSVVYSKEKPTGTFRIALMGDSFIEAVQVPLEGTMSSLLENKLNAMGGSMRYEVIPIAKSGNGTLMNLKYAEAYAMRYDPDLIINGYISNDLQDDISAISTLHATSSGVLFDQKSLYLDAPDTGSRTLLFVKHFLLERSLLFERWWMNAVVIKNQLKQKKVAVDAEGPSVDSFIQAQFVPETALARQMWTEQKKALLTFDKFAKDRGKKFALVQLAEGYLIEPSQLETRYAVPTGLAETFDSQSTRLRLSKIASEGGFSFFSMLPLFSENYKKTGTLPVLSCDNHYNELGHEWAADALYGYLIDPSTKLLPIDN